MATSTTTTKKKTTASKPRTTTPKTAKAEPVTAEPVVEETPVRFFKDSDGIPCRSITQGGLYMEGAKTHMHYEWVTYGDITYVEYADLSAAVRMKSSYVFGPTFIIEDEDFINEFPQLKKFYTENYTMQDLENILTFDVDKMIKEIKLLPHSAVESMKILAASAVADGTLDSVKKINALDEVFGTNMSLLAEFNE